MVAGEAAVVPGLVAAVRLEEMERQRRRLLFGRLRGCFDRLRHLRVQLASAAIRESLVGCLANELIAETQTAADVRLDEFGQPRPDCLVDFDPVRERCGE